MSAMTGEFLLVFESVERLLICWEVPIIAFNRWKVSIIIWNSVKFPLQS